LVVSVAAAQSAASDVLVVGVAGLVAGAMSMADDEYVFVSSQADTEQADLDREGKELATDVESELSELTAIYASRGVEPALAKQVAGQLMAHDALSAHARDELGNSDMSTAKPIQAAFASAGTFAVGAALPRVSVLVTPAVALIPVVIVTSILFLALLGGYTRGPP
jgi:vacuolar iron transporter family protein